MYNIVLIPARGGSKSIPRKNLILLRNKPLLIHSIDIASKSKYIDYIFVSSDDEEILNVVNKYSFDNNIENLFTIRRPSDIAQDLSPDIDTFKHFLEHIRTNLNEEYNINLSSIKTLIHLRPTYPNRDLNFLNHCIETFNENYENYDSLRTVVPLEKSPYKCYTIENNKLMPLFELLISNEKLLLEPYNLCRQALPQTYIHNGNIDIIKPSVILDKNSMSGGKILPIIEKENLDIDTFEDLKKNV